MGRKKQRVRWNPVNPHDPDQATTDMIQMETSTQPQVIVSSTEPVTEEATAASSDPEPSNLAQDNTMEQTNSVTSIRKHLPPSSKPAAVETPPESLTNCETVSNPGSTHSVTHSHTSSNHSGGSGYRNGGGGGGYYRGYKGGGGGSTHYHNGPPPPPPHRRYNSNGDRSQGGSPWVAPLAPRFERNKMSNYGGHNNGYHGGHRQNSLDGVVGESDQVNGGGGEGSLMGEDLPNGFTKIRSKNLDVLFKKDYYATAAAQKAPKPEGEGEEASENPASEKDSEGTPQADTETAAADAGDADAEGESATDGVKDAPELTEKGEENKENEKESGEEAKEKTDDSSSPPPLKSAKKLTIRTDASPFYPRSYQFHNNPTDPSNLAPSSAGSCQFMPTAAAATATGDQQQTSVSAPATAGAAGAKPNLFLYSPASNTIIPCEEIMIPNHSSAASTATTATVATVADAQVAAAGYHPGAAAAAAHHHSVVAAAAAAAAGPNIYMTGYPQHDGGYLSAPATAPAATTTFPPPPQLINPMVHYDQFGVAYTSYVPPYANTPPVTAAAAPLTTAAAANAGGQQPTTAPPETYSPQQQQQQLSDSSSSPAASSTSPASVSENGATPAAVTAGSSEPLSPPDLSVYSPANWVPADQAPFDPALAAAAAANGKKMAALSVSTFPGQAGQGGVPLQPVQPTPQQTTPQVYYHYHPQQPQQSAQYPGQRGSHYNGGYQYGAGAGGGNVSWGVNGGGGGGSASATAGNTSSSSAEISPQGRHHRNGAGGPGTNGYHYNTSRYHNSGNSYSNGYPGGKRGYHGGGGYHNGGGGGYHNPHLHHGGPAGRGGEHMIQPHHPMGPQGTPVGMMGHHHPGGGGGGGMGGGASVGAITTTNESSTVPSSAADSTAEGDRSEDETSKSSKAAANYNKKGALQDVTAAGKEVKEQPERFIPGLNTSASTSMMPPAKRVQKKRRKKKAAAAAAAAMAAVNSGSVDQTTAAVITPSGGETMKASSSSEDLYHQHQKCEGSSVQVASKNPPNRLNSAPESSNCPSPVTTTSAAAATATQLNKTGIEESSTKGRGENGEASATTTTSGCETQTLNIVSKECDSVYEKKVEKAGSSKPPGGDSHNKKPLLQSEPPAECPQASVLSYSAVVSSKTQSKQTDVIQSSSPATTQNQEAETPTSVRSQPKKRERGPRNNNKGERKGERASASSMATASSVAPLTHESAEQVVSEEGWELSGSKTFKRNRKNRSSVKSSAVPALPVVAPAAKKQAPQAPPVQQPSSQVEEPPESVLRPSCESAEMPQVEPEESIPVKEAAAPEQAVEMVLLTERQQEEAEQGESVPKTTEAEEANTSDAPVPVPKKRSSTLKRQNKQKLRREREERMLSEERLLAADAIPTTVKRSAASGSTTTEAGSGLHSAAPKPVIYPTSVRPVLIQDGILDVAGSSAAAAAAVPASASALHSKVKRVSEVFKDPSRIAQVMSASGAAANRSTLIVSDIGHGIFDGPISMGRFGTGKYNPPDRSDEILPMQKKLLEAAGGQAKADSQKTIIKVLMGDVVTSTLEDEEGETEQGNEERIADITDLQQGEASAADVEEKPIRVISTKADVELDLD